MLVCRLTTPEGVSRFMIRFAILIIPLPETVWSVAMLPWNVNEEVTFVPVGFKVPSYIPLASVVRLPTSLICEVLSKGLNWPDVMVKSPFMISSPVRIETILDELSFVNVTLLACAGKPVPKIWFCEALKL